MSHCLLCCSLLKRVSKMNSRRRATSSAEHERQRQFSCIGVCSFLWFTACLMLRQQRKSCHRGRGAFFCCKTVPLRRISMFSSFCFTRVVRGITHTSCFFVTICVLRLTIAAAKALFFRSTARIKETISTKYLCQPLKEG